MESAPATTADLHRAEGQAELIGGRIVRLPHMGWGPAAICGEILVSLQDHEERTETGRSGSATLGYVVPRLPSGRESFCADVSYYIGPEPVNPMDFIPGPPTFAVEVRNEQEFGAEAETALAAKRADYFQAGTLVVWDVAPLAETVACYRVSAPDRPVIFRRGDVADAEPAVPGWRMPVDEMFP